MSYEKVEQHLFDTFKVQSTDELSSKLGVYWSDFFELLLFNNDGSSNNELVYICIDLALDEINIMFNDKSLYSVQEFQEMYNNDKLFQLQMLYDCTYVLMLMEYIKDLPSFINNLHNLWLIK